MKLLQILALLAITAVELEFGLHVIYHAVTGKAGLYDPPFEYLGDIRDAALQRIKKER